VVAGVSANNPIPRTSIQAYYKSVCAMSYAERLQEVDALLEDPTPLVQQFESSVAAFSAYANLDEGFYSNPKRAPKPPEVLGEIHKTHDVAWYLSQQKVLQVEGAPELNARYVDYEIAPARTTDHAVFSDGGSWRTGVFIDLLLANCEDSTPIVAELKIRADKDPFTAIVQMLACAAHLATPHQYERLRQFAPAGQFSAQDVPVVDGYVLLHRFLEVAQDDLEQLGKKAKQLSALLLDRFEIAGRLRRITCLDVEFGEGGELLATKRW
jgi:hypothetical protein